MEDSLFLRVYKSKEVSTNNVYNSYELKEGKNYIGKSYFLSNVIVSLKSVADLHFIIDVYKRPTVETRVASLFAGDQLSFDLEIKDDSNLNSDDHGRVFQKNKLYCYSTERVFYLLDRYACALVRGDALNTTKQKIETSLVSTC